MVSEQEFQEQVNDAFAHLYDLVYLRTHPLVAWLFPDAPNVRRKERAWQLHQLLLGVIDELDPGPHAPVLSNEWRRHRLMVLRYVDGMDPQAAAEELALSRRHYYRKQTEAVEAVAAILWQRYMAPEAPQSQAAPGKQLALLRSEAQRVRQAHASVSLTDVVSGAVDLLLEPAQAQGCRFRFCPDPQELASDDLVVRGDRVILRQIVLHALTALLADCSNSLIELESSVAAGQVLLDLRCVGRSSASAPQAVVGDDLAPDLFELARLQEIEIEPLSPSAGRGYRLRLPLFAGHTVLVVDDNQDQLDLLTRRLEAHRYRVLTTPSSAEGLRLAQEQLPDLIILDIMLSGQDGWEVLQTLVNRPQTAHIPVIISSVLRVQQLALALGAAAFLEKPVSEEALLATIQEVLDIPGPPR